MGLLGWLNEENLLECWGGFCVVGFWKNCWSIVGYEVFGRC